MSYSHPQSYERFMGRWSTRLAPSFVRFAMVRDGQHVLDVGCGTGVLSREIACSKPAARLTGIDPLSDYVVFAQGSIPEERACFAVGRAEELPFPDGTFDAALALLVLQDFSDPLQAVREMARVTRPGGMVAACLWDFRHGMPMLALLWEAAEAVAPEAARGRRPQRRIDGSAAGDLARLWRDSGLAGVETEAFELAMPFSSFDDYWQPFLAGATPTSAFAAALEGQTGGALSRALRERIAGVRPDGSFVLTARARAVRGTAPG